MNLKLYLVRPDKVIGTTNPDLTKEGSLESTSANVECFWVRCQKISPVTTNLLDRKPIPGYKSFMLNMKKMEWGCSISGWFIGNLYHDNSTNHNTSYLWDNLQYAMGEWASLTNKGCQLALYDVDTSAWRSDLKIYAGAKKYARYAMTALNSNIDSFLNCTVDLLLTEVNTK